MLQRYWKCRQTQRENTHLTISLLLENCFPNHPKTKIYFSRYEKKCPTLAKSMISTAKEEAENEDQNKSLQELLEDENRRSPNALHRIQPKETTTNNNYNFLSVRKIQQLPKEHDFITQLEKAYCNDYKQPVVHGIQNSTIQWCQKLAFTPRNQDRATMAAQPDTPSYSAPLHTHAT
ncbi:uncharacterized protein TRIVIDRAFT_61271 [Trichoderma virens Gv29-8]|uniref:Uncharacterized protein n=1 Tax=Hypocrea virens (strain Gv29-8 / FGSC 10586) TaxID=413071 RepID=G9MMB0_HYPVG|nr:uncharacterized protein TRIVIDRAFT_61271 [Trichoderma virens Gv29-8]EHK24479.1 hypothetical protein TRIVIDRAFT_61271 [Trichoderma virens Gv29-8]